MVHSKTVASAADLSAPTVARQFYGFTALQIAPSAHAKGSYFSRTGCAPFSCSICWMPDAARCAVLAPLELGGQVKFGSNVQWQAWPGEPAVDSQRSAAFYADVRKCCSPPTLRPLAAQLRWHASPTAGP